MRRRRKKPLFLYFISSMAVIGIAAAAVVTYIKLNSEAYEQPDELMVKYITYLEQGQYEQMYGMLDDQSKINYSQEDFVSRNKKIYEGIEARDIQVEIAALEEQENEEQVLSFQMKMNTVAGEVSFPNTVTFSKKEDVGYLMAWDDNMIFPGLGRKDKILVNTDRAKRGRILDRNGNMLAGPGTVTCVGLVPGKMSQDTEASDADIEKLAGMLGVTPESVKKKLEAKWVKDDSLVPVKNIEKLSETELMKESPDSEALEKKAFQDELLTIPGVMLTDATARYYPLGKAASHLTGYVQNVTAEDLEKHPGEGYDSSSVIGRSGMESLYEKELKGVNGCAITMVDFEGKEKRIVASIPKVEGQDVKLTIDGNLQKELYSQLKNDKSCSVAIQPYTGEVLALVSTPAFDSNDFILGFSTEAWASLNDNPDHPLYNRFRQAWCPGSSFKPVIAGIGLSTGAVDPSEDYGKEGLRWQKDSSWGKYFVTTLHEYEPAILENALIYSDNIYFAKAALKIGADSLAESLEKLGFGEPVPFEITMAKSQYSNSETIESEIQLADSGYGQGQILINPLHLASLYTAFANQGDVVKPYLLYKEQPVKEVWLEQAFPTQAAGQVEKAMEEVVNNPHGTGYKIHREDIRLAGKTGTAEIKASQSDTTGTELGWLGIFTADPDVKNPVLIMTMVEDVKNRGGSGYVVNAVKNVLALYLEDKEE